MTQVKIEENKPKRIFIGRAWINEVSNENSDFFGEQYLKIALDKKIKSVELNQDMNIILWPQEKREGKKDADYRLSLTVKENQETVEEAIDEEEAEKEEAVVAKATNSKTRLKKR